MQTYGILKIKIDFLITTLIINCNNLQPIYKSNAVSLDTLIYK